MILALLIIIDAVFPAVPSESIVISLSAIYITANWIWIPLLFVISVAAAWLGDNIAYQIGTWEKLQDNALVKRPKIAKALEWSKDQLEERGATIIIVGRFIPGVRIAINVMCGVLKFPRRRYFGIVLASSSVWATYSCVIGAVAGAWFEEHKLVGVMVAVCLGVVLGPLVDWILRKTVLRGTSSPGAESSDAESSNKALLDAAPTNSAPSDAGFSS